MAHTISDPIPARSLLCHMTTVPVNYKDWASFTPSPFNTFYRARTITDAQIIKYEDDDYWMVGAACAFSRHDIKRLTNRPVKFENNLRAALKRLREKHTCDDVMGHIHGEMHGKIDETWVCMPLLFCVCVCVCVCVLSHSHPLSLSDRIRLV